MKKLRSNADLQRMVSHISLALARDDARTTSEMYVKDLLVALEDCLGLIDRYQKYVDRLLIMPIQSNLELSVTNAEIAANMEEQFSRSYFAKAMFSDAGKSKLAETLLRLCTPFIGKNKMWDEISKGDFSNVYDDEAVSEDDNYLQDLK